MPYKYSHQARERISSLGRDEINNFIEEISQRERNKFYSQIKLPGFRKGSRLAHKEIQKELIEQLIHSKREAAWKQFETLWQAWAIEKLGDPLPLGDNSELTPDLSITFLKHIGESFPNAPKEVVERLFSFSGFPDHPDVGIELARISQITRDKFIDSLPRRLEDIEGRLDVVTKTISNTNERLGQLKVTVKSVSKHNIDVTKLQAAFDSLNTEFARFNSMKQSFDTLDSAAKELTKADDALAGKINTLEQNLQTLILQGDEWKDVAIEVAVLKDAINCQKEEERISTEKNSETICALSERISVLERKSQGNGLESEPRVHSELSVHKHNEPFIDIVSTKKACEIIASNFQAVGIQKGEAQSTARQIVAALVAGQLIQFSGSLADLVAEALAAAVCGPMYHEWQIPVGLVSGDVASKYVHTVAESSRSLLFKGANLSAFEVYGGPIRNIVMRRQFGIDSYGNFVLIASWAKGPAAFREGGTLAELGPVFDTDSFAMRGISARLPELKFGRLAKDTWVQINDRDYHETPKYMIENLREQLKEIGFSGGALWKRVTENACNILESMLDGKEEDILILLKTRAIPWARATSSPILDRLTSITQTETVDRGGRA
jgi:chaperonin cofactor prefoldin